MSMSAVFVQTREGIWWEEPRIRAADWFVCWDDDEPIELVLRAAMYPSPAPIIYELRDRGWLVYVSRKHHGPSTQRCFSDQDLDFAAANAYFLTQQNGPPTTLITHGTEWGPKQPSQEGVYYPNHRVGL